MSHLYLYDIAVKCIAPEGWKPRTSTYKGFGISRHSNIEEQLKSKAINTVSKALIEQNPSLELKFSATISKSKRVFALNIDDELAGIETVEIPLNIV